MAEKCVNLGCPEVLLLALADACTGAPIAGASSGSFHTFPGLAPAACIYTEVPARGQTSQKSKLKE